MFDIGFSEIVLVGVVSLVVLGPEKMPGAVRTAALMIGRLKRSFNALKTEIEKEIGADEIRRQLRNEEIMEKFKETQTALNNTINSVKEGTEEFRKNIELESQAAGMSSYGGGPAVAPPDSTHPLAGPAETPATLVATSTETAATPASTTATPSAAPAVHTADTQATNDKSAS
jgi:sec-independent protein translocase protein TatB